MDDQYSRRAQFVHGPLTVGEGVVARFRIPPAVFSSALDGMSYSLTNWRKDRISSSQNAGSEPHWAKSGLGEAEVPPDSTGSRRRT